MTCQSGSWQRSTAAWSVKSRSAMTSGRSSGKKMILDWPPLLPSCCWFLFKEEAGLHMKASLPPAQESAARGKQPPPVRRIMLFVNLLDVIADRDLTKAAMLLCQLYATLGPSRWKWSPGAWLRAITLNAEALQCRQKPQSAPQDQLVLLHNQTTRSTPCGTWHARAPSNQWYYKHLHLLRKHLWRRQPGRIEAVGPSSAEAASLSPSSGHPPRREAWFLLTPQSSLPCRPRQSMRQVAGSIALSACVFPPATAGRETHIWRSKRSQEAPNWHPGALSETCVHCRPRPQHQVARHPSFAIEVFPLQISWGQCLPPSIWKPPSAATVDH